MIKLIDELKQKMASGANEVDTIISKEIVDRAFNNLSVMELKTSDDYFLFYASINLINAYVKKEYAVYKNYNFKRFVSLGIESLINEKKDGINFSYNKQLTIVEIMGVQFSFHNSQITDLMKSKESDFQQIEWSNIRLQPFALEIYELARMLPNLSKKDVFSGGNIEV